MKDSVIKEELHYEAEVASTYILEWMRHIICGVHTQETKVNALSNLSEQSAWMVGDWMMKIPPQRYREKMEEWFVMRGISGHVHCFLMPANQGLMKATYFTFLDRCSQDIFTTACVIENDLQQFRKDFPNVNKIHCRNDNASCYAGASAVMVKKEIAENLGLEIIAVDFNEAQKGKDQCDRDGAVAKRAIRRHLNEENDVLNACDIKEALDTSVGALINSKTSVMSVNLSEGHMEKAKIPKISRYHYFKPEEFGFRAWEFQSIGPGKLIPYQPIDFHSSNDVLLPFQEKLSSEKTGSLMREKKRAVTTKLFCSDKDCLEVLTLRKTLKFT